MTPRVLLLGGLDPSGGAGATLDTTVAALHGVEPLPVVLAWTEQNRRGFRRSEPVPAAQWQRALRAVLDDGPVQAVKVGMVGDADGMHGVARALAPLRGAVPIVVDPVLFATAGGLSPDAGLVAACREALLPLASLLTPNTPELAALCAGDPSRALSAGAGAVLQKGGHGDGDVSEDVLWLPRERVAFRRPRLPCGPVRGTGCALAAAIASRLARGDALAAACAGAGDWVAALLRALGPAPPDGLPRLLPLARAPRIDGG